jgi:hypothetical protein
MNGKSACVGSDEVSIRAFEKKSGDTGTTATLAISGLQAAGKITLQYQARGIHEASRLLVATVQKRGTSHPKRGENSGRVLNHVQIVRSLSTFSIADTSQGQESIKLPAGFNAGDWEIVAMIQDSTTGEITAATRAAIR